MQTQTQAVTETASGDLSLEELESMMMGFDDEIEEKEGDSDLDILMINSIDEDIVVEEEEMSEDVEMSLLALAMKTITAKEIAEEIYEEQESTDDHVEKVEGKVVEKVAKVKTARSTTPRKTTFTHSKEELLKERASPNFHLLEKSDLELDEEGQKAKHDEVMALINSMNVKGTAKCMNFLQAVNGSVKMSVFIDLGVNYILGGNAMTKADLEAFFMSSPRNKVKAYNKSTAMPQALTLLKLFTDLKLINKVGSVYELNENSTLVEKLVAIGK